MSNSLLIVYIGTSLLIVPSLKSLAAVLICTLKICQLLLLAWVIFDYQDLDSNCQSGPGSADPMSLDPDPETGTGAPTPAVFCHANKLSRKKTEP